MIILKERRRERERQKQTEIKRDKEVRKSRYRDIEEFTNVCLSYLLVSTCVCVCTSFDEKGTNIPILPLNVVYTNTSEPPGINDTL